MLKGFLFALQNLSRIYIFPLTFDEQSFGRGTAFFPLVGGVIGALLGGASILLGYLFPHGINGALLLFLLLGLTGAMHLDGFMDSADGLLSGRSRERKLEIMKDSRVGAFGVIALVALLLVKYSFFVELLRLGEWKWLILAPVASRWGMVHAIRFFPYVREEGLGKLYKIFTGNREFFIATVTAVIVFGGLAQWPGLVMFAATALVAHFICWRITGELGGMTGDTYGAVNELLEVASLFLIYLNIIWQY